MNNSKRLFIKFEAVEAGEANELAIELMNRLRETGEQVAVEQHRDDPNALALGGELVLESVDDLPIESIAEAIVTFFKEQGGRVPLVIEDRLENLAMSVETASEKIEQQLQEFIKQWFDKPSPPPIPIGDEKEGNQIVKHEFHNPSPPPIPDSGEK